MVGILGRGPRKKLKDAAAWWVRGGGEFDQAREDARVLGFTAESIEAVHGPEEKDFHVWAENWDAWGAFMAVQTQWSTGMSGYTGLDYTRVKAGLELAGVEATPELFGKLRIIESAVLEALAPKDKERTSK